MQPLDAAARKAGVEYLLEHKMLAIHREQSTSGRVLGIAVENNGTRRNIRAHKAVIIATGGSTGNVNFRRMFDPRLTEEYCGLAGMPYSNQDASGELAAIAINASLWGLFNFTAETGSGVTKPGQIGCQYGYVNLRWMPGSPMFSGARASGLRVADWQNVITVNMLGKRFYDETGRQYTANSYNGIDPYIHGSYLNAKNVRFDPNNWINAAMAGIGDGHNGGGPIWAIFDQAAVEREKWSPKPPNVDFDGGFFFSADTVGELAEEDQDEIPARADAGAKPGKNGWRLQRLCSAGPRFRFWQAASALHDRAAALLRRLGNSGHSRYARRPAHQWALPGRRYERRSHCGAVLRRRIGGRFQHAWPCTLHLPGLHRRPQCPR